MIQIKRRIFIRNLIQEYIIDTKFIDFLTMKKMPISFDKNYKLEFSIIL